VIIGREHEITIDDDTDWEARPDGEGRLDIDLAAHELLACLVQRIRAAAPKCLNDIAFGARGANLAADAKEGRGRRP